MKVSTTKEELRFKDGVIVPIGTKVNIEPREHKIILHYNKKEYRIGLKTLNKLTGFKPCPSETTLMKHSDNGFCYTPTGKKVEIDGQGSDGFYSWLIYLGCI